MLCKDLIGQKYNLLTVLSRAENGKGGKARWRCKCECGNETIVSASNLVSGAVKSCGCLRHKPHDTHHLSKTRLYQTWHHIRRRCLSPKDHAYKDYGGRGIGICEEWNNDFMAFYNWALENGYKEGFTIERIDNNGGYYPQNCKWATSEEQANNRRSCRIYSHDGKTQNLTQWCKELGLPYKIIHSRLYKSKWPFETAITTPIKSAKKKDGM